MATRDEKSKVRTLIELWPPITSDRLYREGTSRYNTIIHYVDVIGTKVSQDLMEKVLLEDYSFPNLQVAFNNIGLGWKKAKLRDEVRILLEVDLPSETVRKNSITGLDLYVLSIVNKFICYKYSSYEYSLECKSINSLYQARNYLVHDRKFAGRCIDEFSFLKEWNKTEMIFRRIGVPNEFLRRVKPNLDPPFY